jgi:hypothetical protein
MSFFKLGYLYGKSDKNPLSLLNPFVYIPGKPTQDRIHVSLEAETLINKY